MKYEFLYLAGSASSMLSYASFPANCPSLMPWTLLRSSILTADQDLSIMSRAMNTTFILGNSAATSSIRCSSSTA